QPGRGAELLDGWWGMAWVHGQPSAVALRLLEGWADLAGLSKAEQQRLRQRHQRHQSRPTAPVATGGGLQRAAAILGVDLDAEPAQIKRSYRRLLSRHHPDKLMSAGGSEAQQAEDEEREHRNQQAHDKNRRNRC